MQSGLPVLARVNAGNDLIDLIENERVGAACTDLSVETLAQAVTKLIADIIQDGDIEIRCKQLAARLFSPKRAVEQIVAALKA